MEHIVYKGNRYKRTKEGYYLRTERLHRRIWEDAYGEIPDRHHIHHKNGIKDDNRIENLECVSEKDHPHHHFDWEEQKKLLDRARVKAIEWHKSDEGRIWHIEHAIQNYSKRKRSPYICTICGADYTSKNRTRSKYCSQPCRSKGQYIRDQISVLCIICRQEFRTFKKKNHARACSPKCGAMLTARIKREKKSDTLSTTE